MGEGLNERVRAALGDPPEPPTARAVRGGAPVEELREIAAGARSEQTRLMAIRTILELAEKQQGRKLIEQAIEEGSGYRSVLEAMVSDPTLTNRQRLEVLKLLHSEPAPPESDGQRVDDRSEEEMLTELDGFNAGLLAAMRHEDTRAKFPQTWGVLKEWGKVIARETLEPAAIEERARQLVGQREFTVVVDEPVDDPAPAPVVDMTPKLARADRNRSEVPDGIDPEAGFPTRRGARPRRKRSD